MDRRAADFAGEFLIFVNDCFEGRANEQKEAKIYDSIMKLSYLNAQEAKKRLQAKRSYVAHLRCSAACSGACAVGASARMAGMELSLPVGDR